MTGRISITALSSVKKNGPLYFKTIDVLETTYSSVKLSYDVSVNTDKLSGKNKVKSIETDNPIPDPPLPPEEDDGPEDISKKLKLSGQEGVDWVQEADHYLIKNTCTEITLSGSTTKEIRIESGGNDLNIILSNLNAPTSQITFNKDISIYIQKNTINNLKCIYDDSNYYYLTIYADNNDNCILNLEKDNRNSSIAARNIIINNGIINAKGNITCKKSSHLKIELNNGIVNTPRFGGDFDAYTDEIILNNGILFTDIIGCSRDDGTGTKIKFLGGITRFKEWNSYILSEIADSAVITTPNQYIFDKLKSKNKGLIIQSQQFTTIDSLKIFDINNDTGEITIKEPLTLNDNSSGSEIVDIMKINENCKVICNNLYFKDGYGNISTKAPDPIAGYGSKLINNGKLTVSPGTRLYINCLEPYYLEHENNGVIYNLGEIDGKEHLKGTGHIVELDLTAEINGELYNDITVDKTNRTITINSLTPETNYDINLIASFEPYIERSKIIKLVTPSLPIYGVRVNENDSNPFTAVTYIEDAIGTSVATKTSLGGWADKFPFNKIRMVGFKSGKVTKEINPSNKTKYTDGSTVPNDVDVMVEIPKVYWKFTNVTNGYEMRISNYKIDSSYDCYAHKVGGVEKDYIYVGAYLGYVESNKLRSRSGVSPTVNTTLTNFRTYAHNVGSGYQQFNWFTLMLLQNLYLLAYKNLNSQNALGYGYANSNSNKTNTGGTNTKGMIFGETGGKQQVCFLGIEDFYGNIFQWVDGMFHNNSYQVTVTPDNKTFNDNGSGFKNVGKFVSSYGSGKISKVAHTNEGGFFPKEFNGSDATYYCDYGCTDSGYFARFGGNWAYGLNAGAFYLNVYCSPSYSNSNLGSRLVFLG